MTTAITGATGQLGRLVVARLAGRLAADSIVALVRNPGRAAGLGVAARAADYDRPETLGPALAGIDTLLLISGSEVGKRAVQHRNVIQAAKRAGVKWIVYTSLLHADRSPLDLAAEHLATERELQASGIPFTLLRNGWYTENYTGSVGGAVAGGALLGSAGGGRISSATRADFAEAAAVVLAEGPAKHAGRTYELAGDTSWTLDDLAAEISRRTGKTIPYRNVPEAAYATALAGFGVPAGFAKLIAGWDTAASQDALFDDSRQLSKLIGRPTTPLSTAVADALRPLPA